MSLALAFVDSIFAVEAAAWNRLLPSPYPFLRHEYLACLETSGATMPAAGWQAHHLVAYSHASGTATLVAAVPLFLKSHSYAEYVFDFSWARAYANAGLDYYPKLVCCAPFAPDPGPRFLIDAAFESAPLITQLTQAIEVEARRMGASGVHCLFPDPACSLELEAAGWYRRLGCQYHWYNRSYGSFDDFLATFVARKRKSVSRERRKALESGIDVRIKTGAEVGDEEWSTFHRFYRSTFLKLSGRQGYLNREFFLTIGKAMPEQVVLIGAYRGAELIAAALCFRDDQTLYGRYWGCDEEVECLHFEVCYYQGIAYAIANGLARFEPGAQGEHKISRGFEPTLTYSNHWLEHVGARPAIAGFVAAEAREITAYLHHAAAQLPFRRTGAEGSP